LPEVDEYKPHLNIRCESYGSLIVNSTMNKQFEGIERTFSRKILFGSCTIKSIGDYCVDDDKLLLFCKRSILIEFFQKRLMVYLSHFKFAHF
jgi:hypothetical protein